MSSVSLKGHSEGVPDDRFLTPSVLPTLFGEGYGNFKTRGRTFAFSFAAHFLCVALVLLLGKFVTQHRQATGQKVIGIVTDTSPMSYLHPFRSREGEGVVVIETSWQHRKVNLLGSHVNNWHLPSWWCEMRIRNSLLSQL